MDGLLTVIDMLGRTITELRAQLERQIAANEMLSKRLQGTPAPQVDPSKSEA